MVKEGTRWSGNGGGRDVFHIIQIIEVEGHTWVHYIKENAPENSNREYSCYIESFLQRFTPLPE